MKPSSGHLPRITGRVATFLVCAVCTSFTGISAHAQKISLRANADGTPGIDAAITHQRWPEALTQLDARIASQPRDAQAKFKRGTVLAHLQRDEEAVLQFTELTQLYPELPEPHNNLAALYAKQGRYEEARTELLAATQATPNYGLAYENLGDLYLRLAMASYQRAQQLGPPNSVARQRIADLEKIVLPKVKASAFTPTTPQPLAAPTMSDMSTTTLPLSPVFQFGGPSGSLAVPPYLAPSK